MRNANTKMQGLTLQRPSPKKAEMAPKSQNEGKFDQKENESTLIGEIAQIIHEYQNYMNCSAHEEILKFNNFF